MIRYTSQHCTHAHRNVRLGIRGFGKLMCVPIYCMLVFFQFCFTQFLFDLLRFLLSNAKALSWHYLWTSDVLVCLFKDRLLIIYCYCWIFHAAVKHLFLQLILTILFFNSVVNLVVIFFLYMCVCSISLEG